MQVTIITATEKPVDVISLAAGICYGKDNVSERRLAHCYNNGHMSVFEHAHVTFRIEGISRACMAQLTRHRVASFCVQSQRYCRIDTVGHDWYVMPEAFNYDPENSWKIDVDEFRDAMREAANTYVLALNDGMKPEDARYLLPEATKTNLIMTCNLRELFHIFDMRLAKAAQWEIRGLANEMLCEVGAINDQWAHLMGLYGRAETNYERYFGTTAKAAESISRLVDMYDEAIKGNNDFRSPFTDNFRYGGGCEFGLCHQDTLVGWLESEAECAS